MKASLFSAFAAFAFLASSGAFAASTPPSFGDNRRNDREYGHDSRHDDRDREHARWESERRNNYGYDRNHRVTAREQQRWEAAHRYNGRR